MNDIRAILVADIHLQARAPVCRSGEPDWFEAMARPLEEIGSIALYHEAPVIYAGDIFNRWDTRPEVINFALEHMPNGFAIPGQHDLPDHNYDEIRRSAYWTLVEAGHLCNLEPGKETTIPGLIAATGFPWGFPLEPNTRHPRHGILDVAVIHRFTWCKGTGYPGAPDTALFGTYHEALAGYDTAVFGDNHKGFIRSLRGGPIICNCGGLMRRKSDEGGYAPGVGLLHSDGSVTRHYLDTSEEHFAELTKAERAVERLLDMTGFVDALHTLETDDALDFVAALTRFLRDNGVAEQVVRIITEARDKGGRG